jgi:plastocyanin
VRKTAGVALLLAVTVTFGLLYSSKTAYAHNFGGDQSAAYLAKVKEVPVETHAILDNLGNSDVLAWHFDKIGEYWNANDTKEMNERNQLLAKNIPGTIASIIDEANKTNADSAKVKQLVDNLDGYMAESVSTRIDSTQLQNLSVSAIAITDVLNEVAESYGDVMNTAANSTSGSMSMSDNMSMSSSSGNATYSDSDKKAAYQNAQGLATAAQDMWTQLKAKTPSSVPPGVINNLDNGFSNLKKIVDQRQSIDQFINVLHGTIHTNLAKAYNLQIEGMSSSNNNMNMTGAASPGQKRMEYLKETSMQRHIEHVGQHLPNVGGYNSNTVYMLVGNGTDKLSLNLSVFKSTNGIVGMDVMGGTVQSSTVQAGYAYYLPNMHKFVVYGYVPQKDSMGMSSGVELVKLWATANGKLPISQTDTPLQLKVISSASGIGGASINVQSATISIGNPNNSTSTTSAVSIVPNAPNLADKAYSPDKISVKVGDTVTWTNDDTAVHTVTSGDGSTGTPDGTFDSKILSPHKTFQYTFTKAGDVKYYCQLHPQMTGEVDVS